MIGRRFSLLGAASALTGCGFHPLYAPAASGGNSPAAAELAAITIPVMGERSGQVFRQELQQRFEGAGTGIAKKYELITGMGLSMEGIAVQRDSSTTRMRLTGNAAWTLRMLNLQHTVLAQGSTRVVDGYNILNQQYFAADLESDAAQRRVASTLADQLTIQVATFLKRRAAAPPP